MGLLSPGVTYVYEREGDTVYARIPGTVDRWPIGMDYKRDPLDYRNRNL